MSIKSIKNSFKEMSKEDLIKLIFIPAIDLDKAVRAYLDNKIDTFYLCRMSAIFKVRDFYF